VLLSAEHLLELPESRQPVTSLQTDQSNVAMELTVAPMKLKTMVETAKQRNARPQQVRWPEPRPYFTVGSDRQSDQTSAKLNTA
jgi:hypothetical protein